MREWSEEKDRRVAETTLPDGKWVSTVFLGVDHSCGFGPPLLFETMVFAEQGQWEELDCERYATEEEALRGHEAMVEKWRRGGRTERKAKEE